MSHSDNGPVPDWFRAIQWGNRYPVELLRTLLGAGLAPLSLPTSLIVNRSLTGIF